MAQITLTVTRIGGDDSQLFIEGVDRKGDIKTLYSLEASKQLRHYITIGKTYAIDYSRSRFAGYVGLATGAREVS